MLRSCPASFSELVIHGDRFAAIADVEINRHADGTMIERGLAGLGRGARIVFVKTDFVPRVFRSVSQIPHPHPFVLVTHNSDIPVTKKLFDSAPACVARWYGLNVDHQAPSLVPIPIGMERPGGGGHSADYSKIPQAWHATVNVLRHHTALACWTDRTNPDERVAARKAFEGRTSVIWREPFRSHVDFLRMCGEFRFVISPPGNGIDCHRTWEAMYMGAIPVVKRSHHTNGFVDLPLVLVDDWNSLTDDALSHLYARYSERSWNLEKLFFQYWEDRIRRDAGTLG